MHLNVLTPNQPLLELSVEEAFELQAALSDLLRRHALKLSTGVRPVEGAMGMENYAGVVHDPKQFYTVAKNHKGVETNFHGSLTIMMTSPYTKI